MELRSRTNGTPSLSEQTPGLDRGRSVRTLALRAKAAARARPRAMLGILGGLLLIGVGAFLALRRRTAP
jgi:hypothetical protein